MIEDPNPDANAIVRQLAVAKWIVLVMVLAVSVLVFLYYRERAKHRDMRARVEDHSLGCSTAKMSAFGSVHNAIRSVQMRRDHDANADSFPPGGELAVYVWACAPYRDDEALDMAGEVHSLVSGIFSVGDFEGLETVLALLHDTPVEEWKTLELPEEPSLFLQISDGDEAEAKRLQQAFENAVSGGSEAGAGEAGPLPEAAVEKDKNE